MKQSDITKIYNMTLSNRQSFKENYPTATSLAQAIQQVLMSSTLEKERKVADKVREELRLQYEERT